MSTKVTMARTAAPLAAALLLLAGCGSGTSSAPTSGSLSTDAKASLQTAYKGVTGTVPTTPTTPKPGVSVWVVSCGEAIPSCKTPAAAAATAATTAGWNVKTCDGQLNPDGWGTCVRRAIAAKAEVILPIGLDCASIQQPFEEAKTAGVIVVGAGGADCDVTGGSKLWATERLQLKGYSIKEYWELAGKLNADYLIGKTNGKAKVVGVRFTDPLWGPWLYEGFTKELKTCSGCELVDTLAMANNDFVANTAVAKFSNTLQKNPTANAVFVSVGGWMPAGLSQAVVSSGRSKDLTVTTGFGDEANMGLIGKDAGQDAVMGYSTGWGAWGSVDTAIRVVNGEEPVVEGDGMQVVDKDNALPTTGDYTGGVDFQAAYKKIWGVS